MKAVIGSDFHVHSWKDFDAPLANGSSKRLEETLAPFAVMRDRVKKLGLEKAYHLGDVFHKRNSIYTAAFNRTYEEIHKFMEDQIDLIVMTGNHDQTTRDGKLHSLEAFKDIATVIDEPRWLVDGDARIFFIPFIEDVEVVKKQLQEIKNSPTIKSVKHNLLFAHLGVLGAKAGPYEFQPLEQIKPEDFDDLGLDLVMLGHYHDPQALSTPSTPIAYVGAPVHHSREDAGSFRGITELQHGATGWNRTITPVKVPQFVVKTGDEFNADLKGPRTALNLQDYNGVYLTVDYDPNSFDPENARAELKVRGLNPAGAIYRAVVPKATPVTNRTALGGALDDDQVLKEYLHLVPPPQGLDEKRLVSEGMKLLEQ